MEIFGVGGLELVAIFLIMLIVAGPKRMIQWSYTLGRYVAVLRRMWAETASVLQKELDEAGVDVQVPKDIPTKQNIRNEVARLTNPVTKPIKNLLNEVKTEVEGVRKSVIVPRTDLNARPRETTPPKPEPQENGRPETEKPDYGAWSGKVD